MICERCMRPLLFLSVCFPVFATPFSTSFLHFTTEHSLPTVNSMHGGRLRTDTNLHSARPATTFRFGRVRPPWQSEWRDQRLEIQTQRCECCSWPSYALFMQKQGESDSNQDNEEISNITPPIKSSQPELSPIQASLIGLLKGYKALISPILPPSCRFLPTCSEYSMAAIAQLGPAKGALLEPCEGFRLPWCLSSDYHFWGNS